MDPDIWGKHGWIFLHSISLNYPENPSDSVKNAMRNFILSLQEVLPCLQCQQNFSSHLKERTLDDALSNRENLFKFFVDIHNDVNKINGKKIYTYAEAVDEFKKIYGKKVSKPKKDNNIFSLYAFMILVLCSLLIIIFFIRK